ncbi:MAG: hypothetical protein GQ574_02655 [Crocinitomix sp.]|nr:hypothetical protein [Crocinitomix sp.]
MSNSDLTIEKMEVNVHATNVLNPNDLLVEISAYLQDVILPQLERDGDWKSDETIQLDQVNITFDSPNNAAWKETLGTEIAKKIKDETLKVKQDEALIFETMDPVKVHPELTIEEAFLPIMIAFLETGAIKPNPFFQNLVDFQEKWLKCVNNDSLFTHLSHFLVKNEKFASIFLDKIEVNFLKQLLRSHVSDEIGSFIAETTNYLGKISKYRVKLFLLSLKVNKNDSNSFDQIAASLNIEKRASIYQYLSIISNKSAKTPQKHIKTSHVLMNSFRPKPNNALQHLIKLRTEENLTYFIEDLRRDYSLRESFDPLLQQFFENSSQKHTLEDWTEDFANAVTSVKTLRALLLELEEFHPINNQVKQTAEFSQRLNSLIQKLEYVLGEFESGIRTELNVSDSNTNATRTPKLQPDESLLCSNAGIVLLNPFLPTLFSNLDLLDEANEWRSTNSQIWAIYIVHYFAQGNWNPTFEDLTIGKLLTGFEIETADDFKAVFKTYEQSKKILLENETLLNDINQIEIPSMLKAVQENWRPMRNCTWDGLRNDFLTRSGELSQEENLQYVLTIEPHALDVLLPTIKWGTAMIKYSWMEQVLNVEWGE